MTSTATKNTSDYNGREELVEIDKLIPYSLNSKVHDESNIKGLMASISAHGLANPVLVDKNLEIIGGHGRLEACKRLGMKFVQVRIMDHLNERQIKELRIADNKTASTKYDTEKFLDEIKAIGADDNLLFERLGMDDEEFKKLTMTLDVIDDTAFTEDLDEDVNTQAKESEKDISLTDLKMVSVTNGLGFAKVTVADNRKVARFVADLQEQYGSESPLDAFIRFIDELAVQ